MGRIYEDSSGTNEYKKCQMFDCDGTQTTFTLTQFQAANLDKVYIVNDSHPEGILQVLNTDYYLDGENIVFYSAPNGTDYVLATSTTGNSILYDGSIVPNSSNEVDRTIEKLLYYRSGADNEQNVTINVYDLSPSAGVDPTTEVFLAPDSSGTPGTYQAPPLILGNVAANTTVPFWIKIVVNQHDAQVSYNDIKVGAYYELQSI